MLKAARTSLPIATAICRMMPRSKVAAHDGPLGKDTEQRPSVVQLENMLECRQFWPQ